MYIEKLNSKELKKLFMELVSIRAKFKERVAGYFEKAKIRRNDGAIIVEFNTGEESEYLYIKDYYASVSIDNGGGNKEVINLFRKHMYKKFGEKYFNDLKNFYEEKINEKANKEIQKLNKELKEITK